MQGVTIPHPHTVLHSVYCTHLQRTALYSDWNSNKWSGLTPSLPWCKQGECDWLLKPGKKLLIVSYCVSNTWTWINISASEVESRARAPWPPKYHEKHHPDKWAQWCSLAALKDLSLHYKALWTIHIFHCSHRDARPPSRGSDGCWVIACAGPLASAFDVTSRSAISPIKLIVLMCKVECHD